MEEGAEDVERAEEEAEGIEASRTLSRHHQFFPWGWALLRNRELVRLYSLVVNFACFYWSEKT